jgi:Tfp pilus assembly protein PilN
MRAVNLIPAEQRRGASGAYGRSDGAAFVVLGLLAGLVLLAGVYALSHSQVSDRRAQAARLSAQASAAQAQAASLSAYVSFLSLRDQRVSTVRQLAGTRFDWAHTFHELGRVLPYDVSLSNVKGSMTAATAAAAAAPSAAATAPATGATAGAAAPAAPAASVTSATPPGSAPSLDVTGCTVSQSEVAFTLTRLRLMDGVSSVTLHSAAEASSAAPGTTQDCPVTFSVTVAFNPLPAVSTPAPNTSAPATATTATPPAGSAAGTAPVAATTGAK